MSETPDAECSVAAMTLLQFTLLNVCGCSAVSVEASALYSSPGSFLTSSFWALDLSKTLSIDHVCAKGYLQFLVVKVNCLIDELPCYQRSMQLFDFVTSLCRIKTCSVDYGTICGDFIAHVEFNFVLQIIHGWLILSSLMILFIFSYLYLA